MFYIILMCISCFMFFANDLLLAVYLLLTIEVTLEKKQIRAIFLSAFKMGHKARETTHNINNAFGPGTANESTMQ